MIAILFHFFLDVSSTAATYEWAFLNIYMYSVKEHLYIIRPASSTVLLWLSFVVKKQGSLEFGQSCSLYGCILCIGQHT
jgi:hypothetical protein